MQRQNSPLILSGLLHPEPDPPIYRPAIYALRRQCTLMTAMQRTAGYLHKTRWAEVVRQPIFLMAPKWSRGFEHLLFALPSF